MVERHELSKIVKDAPNSRASLPISKLRGVPQRTRVALKAKRITSTGQLLRVAGTAQMRAELAAATGIDRELLTTLVQRADLTRVSGIGAIFGLMLEDLGIRDVQTLAAQEPRELHTRLREYNERVRLARRSPTPEEVNDWVSQARQLEPLVSY